MPTLIHTSPNATRLHTVGTPDILHTQTRSGRLPMDTALLLLPHPSPHAHALHTHTPKRGKALNRASQAAPNPRTRSVCFLASGPVSVQFNHTGLLITAKLLDSVFPSSEQILNFLCRTTLHDKNLMTGHPERQRRISPNEAEAFSMRLAKRLRFSPESKRFFGRRLPQNDRFRSGQGGSHPGEIFVV